MVRTQKIFLFLCFSHTSNISKTNRYYEEQSIEAIFKNIDTQPIFTTKKIKNDDKSSTETREADIIFGDDIVEYE